MILYSSWVQSGHESVSENFILEKLFIVFLSGIPGEFDPVLVEPEAVCTSN